MRSDLSNLVHEVNWKILRFSASFWSDDNFLKSKQSQKEKF